MKTLLVAMLALLTLFASACVETNAQYTGDHLYDEMSGEIIEDALRFKVDELLRKPSVPEEQAVGFYSKGALISPSELVLENDALIKVFRGRERHYGAESLVELIMDAAEFVKSLYKDGERLVVADLTDHNGGKLGRHASHQNGLDADLGYYRRDHREPTPNAQSGVLYNFVKKSRVVSNFDTERNWALISYLVDSQLISRIFVDKRIKQHFCDFARFRGKLDPDEVEILRRLRPWPNHANHLHVRLICPQGNPRCKSQKEPPKGSGCK